MKTLTLACAVAAALAAALATSTALAQEHKEKCEPIPTEEWRPQADLEKMLVNKGWKISRVKITNGCYEVYARDAKNDKKEVFFHPKTLQVVTAPQ